MPELVYSIPTFTNSLKKLLKKASYGYISCKKDIYNELKHKSFEDVFNATKVKDIGTNRIVKIRYSQLSSTFKFFQWI